MSNNTQYYLPIKGNVKLYTSIDEALQNNSTHKLDDVVAIPRYTANISSYVKRCLFRLLPSRGDIDFSQFQSILKPRDILHLSNASTIKVYAAHKIFPDASSQFCILLKGKHISRIYKSEKKRRGAMLVKEIEFTLYKLIYNHFYYYNILSSLPLHYGTDVLINNAINYNTFYIGKSFIDKEDDFYMKIALTYILDNKVLIKAEVL